MVKINASSGDRSTSSKQQRWQVMMMKNDADIQTLPAFSSHSAQESKRQQDNQGIVLYRAFCCKQMFLSPERLIPKPGVPTLYHGQRAQAPSAVLVLSRVLEVCNPPRGPLLSKTILMFPRGPHSIRYLGKSRIMILLQMPQRV